MLFWSSSCCCREKRREKHDIFFLPEVDTRIMAVTGWKDEVMFFQAWSVANQDQPVRSWKPTASVSVSEEQQQVPSKTDATVNEK